MSKNWIGRLLLCSAIGCFAPVSAQPQGSLKIFMAPDGNDANGGLTATQPVQSLERVRVLIAQALKDNRPKEVDVSVAPGTYQGQGVVWDVLARDVPVRISGSRDDAKPSVFDGSTSTTNFFIVRLAARGKSDEKLRTNLTIRDLTVRNYCEGISFGDFKSRAPIADNTVERVRFENIGTKYESAHVEKRGACVAAVRVQRASDITIKDSTFTNIENLPKADIEGGRYGPLALHAIYIADFSDNVTVTNSQFRRFTGTPIRFRNRSNGLRVIDSSFSEAIATPVGRGKPPPRIAAVSQWNCTVGNKRCVAKRDECPSSDAVLRGNRIDSSVDLYRDENEGSEPTCADRNLTQRYRSRAPEFMVQTQ